MIGWSDVEKLASDAVDTVASATDEVREVVSEALESAANWIKPEEKE